MARAGSWFPSSWQHGSVGGIEIWGPPLLIISYPDCTTSFLCGRPHRMVVKTISVDGELNLRDFWCILVTIPFPSPSHLVHSTKRKWPALEKCTEKMRKEIGLIFSKWIMFTPSLPPPCKNWWLGQKLKWANSLLSWAAGFNGKLGCEKLPGKK